VLCVRFVPDALDTDTVCCQRDAAKSMIAAMLHPPECSLCFIPPTVGVSRWASASLQPRQLPLHDRLPALVREAVRRVGRHRPLQRCRLRQSYMDLHQVGTFTGKGLY
jgi:hypothetical protein